MEQSSDPMEQQSRALDINTQYTTL